MRAILTLLLLGSQIHPQRVPLEKVVQRSGLVVLAEADKVSVSEEKLPLDPGKTDLGTLPAFVRVRRRYVVKEVLFDDGRSGAVRVGHTLEVDDPNWALNRAMSHASQTNGVMPSLSIQMLQNECFPDKATTPALLFLRRVGADLQLTIHGAWEKPASRKQVEAALNRP